jgi:hypothetical protein
VRDIRGMLLVNGDTIDRAMLNRATAELGLEAQWREVQVGLG